MPICLQSINALIDQIGKHETIQAIKLAKHVETLEKKWERKLELFLEGLTEQIIDDLVKTGRVSDKVDEFAGFFTAHAFDVMFDSMEIAIKRMPRVPDNLAKYPKGPMPRSLKDLMKLWDDWRKKKTPLPRQKQIAKSVKDAYINKCQDTWRKYSEEYRKGGEVEKAEVIEKVRQASKTEYARSKTIVETETTRYWNQTRREVYDQSEEVTHYLFVPIRDMATTKWCSTRRSLVYTKGTAILDKETPPIHWNCRSEILPLSPFNPRHKALIDNLSMRRENHSPEPLPRGWNSK